MRPLLLILASLAVLGSAYGVYLWLEPTPTGATQRDARAAQPLPPSPKITEETKRGGLLPGHGAWMEQYDKNTGLLSTRFRADEYQPRKNGTVLVKNPTAEFYLGGREHPQHIDVVGIDGEIVVKDMPSLNSPSQSGLSGMPNRGRINQVVMKLRDDSMPTPPPDKPDQNVILTLWTNNIAFDNDTFRITTEAFTQADGVLVTADQAPVTVRGEYDFDGRGLTLRWNDRDGRLELLEIAHGERLVAYQTGDPGKDAPPKKSAPIASVQPAEAPAAQSATDQPVQVPVVSALQTKSVPPSAATPAPRASAGANDTVYAATFYDSVRITQGAPMLATADRMCVNFRMRGGEARTSSAKPSTAPAINPAEAHSTAPLPATAPAPAVVSPASLPATRASAPPMVITWTGKLRIVPTEASPRPVVAGESIVQLFSGGEPVFVHRASTSQQEGTDVRCASLLYVTSDGSASLDSSRRFPQVLLTRLPPDSMPGEKESTVTSRKIDYSSGERVATLSGTGHALFPLSRSDRGGQKLSATPRPADAGVIEARWTQQARLFFSGGRGRQEMSLEHATFKGDVDVKHPQLLLQSQALDLSFAPLSARDVLVSPPTATAPATQPGVSAQLELKQVVAVDRVHCRLTDAAGKQQTIDCVRLDLHTARSTDGRVYARDVDARGDGASDVHAFDATQDLKAGHLEMTLRPTAKPVASSETLPASPAPAETAAVELERMKATSRVRVAARDGGSASADELRVVMQDNQPHITLSGESMAHVWDAKQNLVSGPLITFDPRQGHAHVVGPGTMHMIQADAMPATQPVTRPAAPVRPPRVVEVAWSNEADIDAAARRIDVWGKVVSTSPDIDGAQNTSNSEHVRIDLVKKAAAPAATSPAATRPTTSPASLAGSMQTDLFKDMEPALITLDQNAVVASTLKDGNGNILRQFELKAPLIRYALLRNPAMAAHTLLVPTAGQMLVRDYRASDPKAKTASETSIGGRGATAFQWNKQLLYSEESRRADMTGGVVIVHQPPEAKDAPARLNAEEVTAFFKQPVKPAEGSQAAASPTGMELKWLTAREHVFVTRGTAELTSDRIDLDPTTHWMTSFGSESQPAIFTNTANNDSTTARQVDWNTQTWDVKFKNVFSRSRR